MWSVLSIALSPAPTSMPHTQLGLERYLLNDWMALLGPNQTPLRKFEGVASGPRKSGFTQSERRVAQLKLGITYFAMRASIGLICGSLGRDLLERVPLAFDRCSGME